MSVLNFKRSVEPEKYITGKARCMVCGHKHIAVATVGSDWLRCPECRLHKARFVHAALPGEGEIFQCSCGCTAFVITRDGFVCIHCATTQNFDVI